MQPIDSSSPYGPSAAEYWHYEKLSGSSEPEPAPVPQPSPPGRQPSVSEQKITNTGSVRLVRDPMHWDDDSYLLRKLPKGTRLDVLDKGAGESFNQTAETYHWWKVRAIGTDGWVMQALLDDVTGSP